MSDDPMTIVSAYFDAWRVHDPGALRRLLADDATFIGPLGHSDNADDYQEAIGRMFGITTDIVIRKMVADDADVLTWFDLHTSVAPPAAVANWSRIENGSVVQHRAGGCLLVRTARHDASPEAFPVRSGRWDDVRPGTPSLEVSLGI
jgi:hypothetical protein